MGQRNRQRSKRLILLEIRSETNSAAWDQEINVDEKMYEN